MRQSKNNIMEEALHCQLRQLFCVCLGTVPKTDWQYAGSERTSTNHRRLVCYVDGSQPTHVSITGACSSKCDIVVLDAINGEHLADFMDRKREMI